MASATHVFEFEGIDDSLPFMPLAARRALDAAGVKLSLESWQAMPIGERRAIILAGVADRVDAAIVHAFTARITQPSLEPRSEPLEVPAEVRQALGDERPIDAARWAMLTPLERYALWKSSVKPEKLARAYDAIVVPIALASVAAPSKSVPPPFAHLDAKGAARMVGVGGKDITERRAVASARVKMSPATLTRIARGDASKGDVLAVARVAGIQAAKKTPDLIPLCHGIALTRVEVDFAMNAEQGVIDVRATAEATDRTGVEMEAMVAASVAALTIYDMVKSADRWMTVERVQLEEKSGGRSGSIQRP